MAERRPSKAKPGDRARVGEAAGKRTKAGEVSRKPRPSQVTHARRGAANRSKPVDTADSGAANRSEATSAGRTGKGPNSGSWQPGQSGNPKGAPRRGESWRETVKAVGDKTLAEALERYPWLSHKVPDGIRQYPAVFDSLTLKEVVVANVFGALIDQPDSALWNGLMNRAEGNPEQPLERTWKAELAEWLRDGKVSLEEIKGRLSDELYAEFVIYVGAAIPGNR